MEIKKTNRPVSEFRKIFLRQSLRKSVAVIVVCLFGLPPLAALSTPAHANFGSSSLVSNEITANDPDRIKPPPPTLEQVMAFERKKPSMATENSKKLPFDIRREAIREAAISYGARAGLSWRTYHIRKELEGRARYLDKVFDFKSLLIPAPSGMLIEPPIISESTNNMLIENDGQQAAVSDVMYNISMNARIVSAPRIWRNYLEREWDEVAPPPDILLPEDAEESALWQELIGKGWEEGVTQADEIFEEDLNLMLSDFRGMVRYRALLSQGMVSPPYALMVDRGVTGDGKEMRIGDRAVQITGVPELITGYSRWQPASR